MRKRLELDGELELAGGRRVGKARIVFSRPQAPSDKIGAFLLTKGLIPQIARKLARSFQLPHPLTVRAVNGIGGGPFYSSRENAITLPYGFTDLVFQTLRRSNPSWSGRRVGYAAAAVDGFLLEHEFGHALIHNFDLPVLGKEEDAADQIATVLLLNSPQGPKLATSAAEFFADFSGRQRPPALADYADAHSLDLQRAFSIMCDAAGSSKAEFLRVRALRILPASRLATCPEQYRQAVDSIKQELDPHLTHNLNLGN